MKRFREWCDAVTDQVRFRPDRQAIAQELEDHYIDRTLDLVRIGYDRPAAEEKALAAMGDARAIGRELDRLHSPWLGWLWLASRYLAVVCVAVCALHLAAELPPPILEDLQPVRHSEEWGDTAFFSSDESFSGPVAVSGGKESVLRGGFRLSVPYAAAYRDARTEDQRWIWLVLDAEDDSFWDKGLDWDVIMRLEARDSAGNWYCADHKDRQNDGVRPPGHLGYRRVVAQNRLCARYALCICYIPEDVEWVELYDPGSAEPWSIRVEWKETLL